MRYLFFILFSFSLQAIELSPSTDNASVYFISPNNGESVPSKFKVQFGLENFGIAPAGIQVMHSGHHHLIIDTDLPPLNLPIPADKNHIHFGKGQTEVEIELTKGEHTLQLLLGDFRHIPHDPPIFSKKITVKVN